MHWQAINGNHYKFRADHLTRMENFINLFNDF